MALLVICVLLASAMVTLFLPVTVSAKRDIYVKSIHFGFSDGTANYPYKSIQEAIDIATSGDSIYVFGGLYQEQLQIGKQLRLWGGVDGKPSVIQAREDIRYTVEITTDYVVFQDFTVNDGENRKTSPIGALVAITSNAGNVIINNNIFNDTKSYAIYIDSNSHGNEVIGNKINRAGGGIRIYQSNTNDVSGNIIANCSNNQGIATSGYGIHITSSFNTRLYNNIVENSSIGGVYATGSTGLNVTQNRIQCNGHGIQIEQSNQCIIQDNTFQKNTGNSLQIDSAYAQIFNNRFMYNQRGIFLQGISSMIHKNVFLKQDGSGILATSSSSLNVIYLNEFRNNGKSAIDQGSNFWYYEEQGNYWSDYDWIDIDLDGIGDKPYDTEGTYDLFPLGYFLKPPNKPHSPSPGDGATGVGLSITFKVRVIDPDSEKLTAYFYRYMENEDDLQFGKVERVQNNTFATLEYQQPFNATFFWYVVVSDGLLENTSDIWFFTTAATPPDNQPPVALISAPSHVEINRPIQFDGSQSYDTDGEISYYRWNFGDGTSEILLEKPTHSYSDPGTYTVTLTVVDNRGTSAVDTKLISVGQTGPVNSLPYAVIGYPLEIEAGKPAVFSGVNSSDEDGVIVSYLWDFGDGTQTSGASISHTYSEAGMYLVTLVVTDDDGGSHEASVVITVSEASPGFEILLFVVAVFCIFFVWKKNRKAI